MKQRLLVILGLSVLFCQIGWAAQAKLDSDGAKLSYTIGVDIGKNLKSQLTDLDPDVLSQGIKDAVSGNNLLMTDDEMQQTITSFQKKMAEKQQSELKKVSDTNGKKGSAFLAENKTKDGVKTLPSGLQYKVIEPGKGASPKANDIVTVNYEGSLVDGKVFDSSYKRGEPVTLDLSQVIDGWKEALPKMKVGATWELYIPPALAYGNDAAMGGPVGPNQTLIFKVNLLSIGGKNKKS